MVLHHACVSTHEAHVCAAVVRHACRFALIVGHTNREGGPLNWPPSAHAVAGEKVPLWGQTTHHPGEG